MSNKIIYITKEDHNELQDLIKAAREFKLEEHGCLNDLQLELNKAKIVERKHFPKDYISMHSIVELIDLKSNEMVRHQIVFPEEADIDKQKISVLAPLGIALIGEKEHTEIELNLVYGRSKFRINKVIV